MQPWHQAAVSTATQKRKSWQSAAAHKRRTQSKLLHITKAFSVEAGFQFPCSGAGASCQPGAQTFMLPWQGDFPASKIAHYFPSALHTQQNCKTISGTRNHYFVLYSEKEALLVCIMTILYFLIAFHPFPSFTPPKILFAFLIRLTHWGDAFRELAVTVPRSFSWAESINLHLWE